MPEQSQSVPGQSQQTRPWERQPGEGQAPWLAFREYMKRRSLGEVAERVGSQVRTIRNYSSKWNWAARVEAWDSEQARHEDAAVLDERGRLAKEHLAHWHAIRNLAMSEVSKMIDHVREAGPKAPPGTVDISRFERLVRTVDLATKNERLVIGEATERADVTDSREGLDLSRLPVERVLELRKILREAKGE